MYNYAAYKLDDGRIGIFRCWPHMNIILADSRNKTIFNDNYFSVNWKNYEQIDLMDYPKLVPHMIKVVRDQWLYIHQKNKLAKLLLSKGLSEENVKYGIDYSAYKDVESIVKYLRVRGRLW